MTVTLFSVVQGLVLGLEYGLLALGLVLIYRTNRVLNFAQGQLGVVSAVLLLKLTRDLGLFYWPSLFFVLAIACGLGALSELLLRRLFARPRVLMMVATIGLAQVLFLLTLLPFVAPKDLFVPYPLPFNWTLHIGGGILQPGEVATLIVAPLVALALALFMRYSPWGLAMRAMSENTDSARLSGVWVRRMSTLAWMIAGLLSAITAILDAPGQSSALKEALPPGLLLRALAAALIAGMTSFGIAFLAGVGIGIVEQVLNYNLVGDQYKSAEIILWLLVLIMVVLVVRVRRLQRSPRTEERSSWASGGESGHFADDRLRQWVGRAGVGALLALAALLPLVVSPGRSFLLARVCLYAVIALSLTVLTGWAGQVSLGQFGLVAIGAITASQLGDWNLVLLIPFTGLVTAIVAIVIGLPALRIRGLYLAVTTLGFALFMQQSVLATPCWKAPLVGTEVCTGLPDPASTLVHRPSFLGLSLASDQSFAWFCLGVLLVFLVIARTWRDRGIARRLIAVRDNETGAAAMGVAVVRTKLLAFALSGFMAGCAGVCLAFALERFQPGDFAPAESVLVLAMVVVGGLGSVLGAVLGALYLVGLPAALGSTATVQFVTSGFGVLAFLLYLPGGLAEHRARLWRWCRERDRTAAGPSPGGHARRCDRPRRSRAVSESSERGPSGPARSAGSAAARLELRDVAVAYGGVLAVDGVTFGVEPGEIVGLIGPNGSGKTTLLDAISGITRCTSGSVVLDGEDLVDHLPEDRARLGLVRSFQDCRLFPELTVEEVLLVSEDARHRAGVLSTTLQLPWARRAERTKREAADRVIHAFGLDRFRRHRVSELSTGTRRVVDLATIVLASPRLLLLDEPTAGIAEREAEAFVPLLQRIHEVTGATIVLVEHDVPLVFSLCSHVVVMETGRVASRGTVDAVRADPAAVAAYLGASPEALARSGDSSRRGD